ncbi:MAG: iron-sulfur cluster assembly scaffold protein [Pseudomonadota bacterium]
MEPLYDEFDEIEDQILADARRLYSETVLDHFKHPRNLDVMNSPDAYIQMSGMCGETIGIFVGLDGDVIDRISFVTDGCGPTVACGSAVTCLAEGRTTAEAGCLNSQDVVAYLGGLPNENVACAELAVNVLRGALAEAGKQKRS